MWTKQLESMKLAATIMHLEWSFMDEANGQSLQSEFCFHELNKSKLIN